MIDSVSKVAAGVPETPPASEVSSVPPIPAASAPASQDGANPSRTGAPAPAKPPQAATRLLVEPNGAHGYVYRLVDATTGRTIVELPRERIGELKSHPDYAAGALVARTV